MTFWWQGTQSIVSKHNAPGCYIFFGPNLLQNYTESKSRIDDLHEMSFIEFLFYGIGIFKNILNLFLSYWRL